jgi:hypothetical protein
MYFRKYILYTYVLLIRSVRRYEDKYFIQVRKYLFSKVRKYVVQLLPDVPSYFPKVRMYFISYESIFESNVVHLYSVHISSYNLLYFRIPSHLVLIRLVVMARAGG